MLLFAALAFNVPLAHAVNVLQNPGFETGDFSGWDDVFSCCAPGQLLTVTAESPHSGAFVADFNAPGSLIDPQDMFLGQTFPAISTEEVNELSFWVRSVGFGFPGQFRAHYTDGSFTSMNIPDTTAEWQQIDMTAILTPGKLLNKVLILNSADPPRSGTPDRDFFDDFVVDVAGEATFNVTKDFSDDNPGQVSITFACSNGTGSTAVISESSPAQFAISDFGDGVSCSITEDAEPAGYTVSYSADCEVAAVANAGVYDCAITNEVTAATFLVTKTFSDGDDDEVSAGTDPQVEVTLSCNNGLPLEQSFVISDADPVNFVVTNFTEGEMDCEVTETGGADGYTPSYDNGSVVSNVSCAYTDVVSGEFSCAITNNADPAEFTVSKDWVIEGTVGDQVSEQAEVTIHCNNFLLGDFYYSGDAEYPYAYSTILSGDGDSVKVRVDTSRRAAKCYAEEDVDRSGVETVSDCGPRTIPAGGSSACTITNTVFFEGIPALSQYGLALLALLMLGVGFVGLRRFV